MTNREMFLLATSILFASTTAGLVLKGAMHHHHGRPGFERMDGRPGDRMEGRDGNRMGDRFGPHGPDGKPGDRGDRMFTETDTNKDGFITKDEMLAKQQARMDEFFTTVDTNHDGKLSKDEMEKGRELMRARFEAKRHTADAAAPEAAPVAASDAAAPAAAPAPAPAQ